MPRKDISVIQDFRRMGKAQLVEFINRQEQIEKENPNPTPANRTLHEKYTRFAKNELMRRSGKNGAA